MASQAETMILQMKKCGKCKQEKPLSEFSKYKRSKDGYNWCCKDCKKLEWQQYFSKNKIKRRLYNRGYYSKQKKSKIIKEPIFILLDIQSAEYHVSYDIPQLKKHLFLGFGCDPCELSLQEFVYPTADLFDENEIENYIIFTNLKFCYIKYKGNYYWGEFGEQIRYYEYGTERELKTYYFDKELAEKLGRKSKNYYVVTETYHEKSLINKNPEKIVILSDIFPLAPNYSYAHVFRSLSGKPISDPKLLKEILQFVEEGINSKKLIG